MRKPQKISRIICLMRNVSILKKKKKLGNPLECLMIQNLVNAENIWCLFFSFLFLTVQRVKEEDGGNSRLSSTQVKSRKPFSRHGKELCDASFPDFEDFMICLRKKENKEEKHLVHDSLHYMAFFNWCFLAKILIVLHTLQ